MADSIKSDFPGYNTGGDEAERAYYRGLKNEGGGQQIHESLLSGRYAFSIADLKWLVSEGPATQSASGLPDAKTFANIFAEVTPWGADKNALHHDDWHILFLHVVGRKPAGDSDPAWDNLVKLLHRHRNPR